MDTFRKKLKEAREAKNFSQAEIARQIEVHHPIIGKYERDEVKPSIDVVKKLAQSLGTTVSFLMGEAENQNIFKDPVMLQRLAELDKMESTEKSHILHVLDGFIKSVKLKNIAAL